MPAVPRVDAFEAGVLRNFSAGVESGDVSEALQARFRSKLETAMKEQKVEGNGGFRC